MRAPCARASVLLILVLLVSSVAFGAEGRISVPLGDSPSIGPAGAPVVIVEFLDYQ